MVCGRMPNESGSWVSTVRYVGACERECERACLGGEENLSVCVLLDKSNYRASEGGRVKVARSHKTILLGHQLHTHITN